MCQASAYIEKDGKKELIMQDVDTFESSQDHITLVNIFGEEKEVKARIKRLYLVDHKIILEEI